MQWGNQKPFNLTDINYEEIEQEIRQTENRTLMLMGENIDSGNSDALEYIGTAYLRGSDGLHADFEKAITFLQLAAECGSTTAQHYLGECYAFGIGVPVSLSAAENYYRLAAQSTIPAIRNAALARLDALDEANMTESGINT